MADENEQRRLQPEAADAPNRDKRGEPPIIEGEATDHEEAVDAAGRERSNPESPASHEQPPSPSGASDSAAPQRGSRRFAAAALGAVVGAAAAAIVFWLGGVNADAGLTERIAALEAPIADLTRRVSALEAAAQNARASADAIKAAQSDSQAARSDAAKALALANKTAASVEQKANAAAASAADLNALDERVKKLESGPPPQLQQAQNGPELSSLEDRLAKVEAALAAPKNETRVAPENASARKDSTGLAVAAEAIVARLASGAPYLAEESALERLGADPAKIAALKPFAEKGAPTAVALAAGFAKVAPDALKAAAQPPSGGVMDRLMSNMSKVVKITPVGEVQGDDPAAISSQIAAALDRGDIAGAMALWSRWPEPARKASQAWAASAQARLAAESAAQGVLNDAMTKLAASDKQ